jgi:ATP-dependent Clp protease ATP-binding subunit ClpC
MNSEFEFSKRLTDNARDSLSHAEILARTSGSAYIGTEHLLLGVLSQESSMGAKTLAKVGVTFERAKIALALTPRNLGIAATSKGLSETAKLTLRMSLELAQEFHQDYCGTEHILFSLLNQKNARATVLIRDMGADVEAILGELDSYLERQHDEYHAESVAGKARAGSGTRGSYLEKFAENLSTLAEKGELDPVVGRDREITRIVTILSRRTKNNPVLIGEPGVGKTAIVEGLAQRMANDEVPDYLQDRKVYQLDLAGMLAGTKYRGEFEERIKRVLDEVRRDKTAIVFIDELHLLMGAGAAEGAMDAANMLKPALARGDFRLIGATTLDEYRRYVEKDAALARRLQSIVVDEPTARDTVKIIEGLAPSYEQHHNVKLSKPVIEEAVRLASRYITERFMPDKALDVIDEAAALVHVKHARTKPTEQKVYQRELARLNEQMEEAVAAEDYERAALYKMRISRLHDKIAETETAQADGGRVTLKIDNVAQAVATMTGVPVAQLRRTEMTRLAHLEKHLGKKSIGQMEAIRSVAASIRRSRSGISAARRPSGAFVFLGPTGVGKTELARVVAEEVFGSDKSLIKIDMSEFSERHTSARLVGAPAGYVGYDDGGQLTEKIRRQPYSVVLFDEIEKAHPDVFNMLLQILEDGRLTDGHGHEVDFSNTVVILTSNLGAEQMQRESQLGFVAKTKSDTDELQRTHDANREAAMDALRKLMRPELINRFDKIVVFDSLSRPEVGQIFDLLIDDLNQRLAAKGLAVKVEPSAKKHLIDAGFNPQFGARPLRRAIQDELEHAIAEGMLRGEFRRGDVVRATTKHGKMVLDKIGKE